MKYTLSRLALTFLPVVLGAPEVSRRAATCGALGYDEGTDSYYYSTETGTYAACSKQCQKDSQCKSFAVGNGECNLYNVPVAGNFEKDNDSPYSFYDAPCITSSTTKPSSMSTTTTAKTTTTTTAKPITTSTASVKPPTTTKASTATTKPPTTAATSSTKTPPCPLPTWTISSFTFFNSSHNADCAGSHTDVGDGTGCLDANGQWCDPRVVANCTHCGIGVCMTGLPTQPVGYGPADYISADISQIGSCYQSNPGTVPLRSLGEGNVVRCGGSQIQFIFNGDSRSASSSPGFYLQNQIFCDNGAYYFASGSADIPISCTYDVGNNATCKLTNGSAKVVATQWS